MIMHSLLRRQLKKAGLTDDDTVPDAAQWALLRERINRTYVESDEERYTLERSLGLSSDEMRQLHEGLQRASDQVTAERDKLQAVISAIGDGLCALDLEGHIVSLNPEGERLLGRDVGALAFTPVLRLFELHDESGTPLDFAGFAERIRCGRALRDEDAALVTASGDRVLVSCMLGPIVDRGTLVGAVFSFRDITERRQAEASQRISEARFKGLWDSGLILVAVSDLAGRIREINDAGAHMLGYARDELIAADLNWDDLTPGQWRSVDDAARSQLAASGVASPWEKELIREDGSRVPILAGAAMLEGSESIVIAVGLTGLKRAEAALRNTEDQLRQAQKLEALGRLAGGVAHDFNNLLSVILCVAEFMRDDCKPGAPMRGDIEEILKAGQRAAALTRQLLMFSRHQVLEPTVLDLNELLSNVEGMLRRIVGEDVNVVLLPGPDPMRVRADPSSIEQVVMNLVVNARDAMPTGGRLTIETENVVLDEEFARTHHGVQAGRHVILAVSDTGVGMDAATTARIFEPFFTTKEKGKGTGLGLSMVFGIVQQSGGTVWVDSEPGRGTSFKIYLPRVDPVRETIRPRVAGGVRGTETVLLVEDDDSVRAVARNILRRHGYEVIEACNAGEALLHCEQYAGTIHLLLSDVVMPHMSGPALARRLLQIRPEMRVLYMSGYTDDSVVRHGVLDATLAFLQKPLTPAALTRKVREVLDAAFAATKSTVDVA